MQPIVLQPVKIAGWSPAPVTFPKPSLAQATAQPSPTPPKAALIDSPIFNFLLYGVGAFAMGTLAFGAAEQKNTTAATVLGIATGVLALSAGFNLYSSQK